jgi:hypothetical protein
MGDLHEKIVSRTVTQAVVEDLELIDIDKQDCESERAVALRNCDGALQAVEKESPVGQSGKPIVEYMVLE